MAYLINAFNSAKWDGHDCSDVDTVTSYIELFCKTNFSFLDGASHASEIIKRAHELKYTAIGICDRNGAYAFGRAFTAAKDFPDLKVIYGAEIVIASTATGDMLQHDNTIPTCLKMIAKTREGYALLCRILTTAHHDKEKGAAFLTLKELRLFLEDPRSHDLFFFPIFDWLTNPDDVSQLMKTLIQGASLTSIYIPISRFHDGNDVTRLKHHQGIADTYGIGVAATNDVVMHESSRKPLHDVISSIRETKTLSDMGQSLLKNAERYLKSPDQMMRLFRDRQDAIQNTVKIANACTFKLSELKYRYPSEFIPTGFTSNEYLRHRTMKGAYERYGDQIPKAVFDQIEYEFRLIEKLNFSDYFLTILDLIDFARERNILCQGRGSAANSAVCYCLGITAIDPIRMNLLFERFISEERGEPPDIDVDFEHERREEVIQYLYQKYGRHRAAMVSAVVTYHRRSAFREVAKVFGLKCATLSTKKINHAFDQIVLDSGYQAEDGPRLKNLIENFSEMLEGYPRHISIHSGGFTLSADPIIETVPVEPARMPGRTIIQWDKYDLDALGLLKVDVLALGILSALQKTLTAVGKKLYELPSEDKATYEMIKRADTVGTFQIESRGQMNMLGRLQPENFYDLVIEVAIVRPGPVVGKMVHPYLKRRRGLEKIDYPDPRLRTILGKTLGVPLFQEQVMKLAIELAGFTPGESDELRRAIGAWRSSGSIDKIGLKLEKGLIASGLSKDFASRVFDQIRGFATYGFPESHAASFALLAYATAYLRCHHLAEFTCALINSQPMGFYAIHTLIDDAKRHGVAILPIDPNVSQWDCTVIHDRIPHSCSSSDSGSGPGLGSDLGSTRGGAIRLGFRIMHGLAKKQYDALHETRERRRFVSLIDFMSRVSIPFRLLEKLAMANAFSTFGQNERQTLWTLLDQYTLHHTAGVQLSLFQQEAAIAITGVTPSIDASRESPLPVNAATIATSATAPSPAGLATNDSRRNALQFEKQSFFDQIREDFAAFQSSTRGHPMQALRGDSRLKLPQYAIKEIRRLNTGARVHITGLTIVRQKPATAKGMVFATLEDDTGLLDMVLTPPIYDRFRDTFNHHTFLEVRGILQRDRSSISLMVHHLKAIELGDEATTMDARSYR